MSLPGNGIFVVQGEMAILVTAMRRGWGSHSNQDDELDALMRAFQDLRDILNQVADLRLLDPNIFLGPFLEVIRSEKTTGPVTCLALSAINKFLCYGLIDPMHVSVPATVENIADSVTHARFVGKDHSSDGVVLMKILQVLRTLVLSPEGAMLTDESVCEIMLSCFRICFETRLNELLRRNAEQCLRDMTQLVFMRLPQFFGRNGAIDMDSSTGALLLRKKSTTSRRDMAANNSTVMKERTLGRLHNDSSKLSAGGSSPMLKTSTSGSHLSTTPVVIGTNSKILDMQGSISRTPNAGVDSLLNDDELRTISENEKTPQQRRQIVSESDIQITLESPSPQSLIRSPLKKHGRHSSMDLASSDNISITQLVEKCVNSAESGVPLNRDLSNVTVETEECGIISGATEEDCLIDPNQPRDSDNGEPNTNFAANIETEKNPAENTSSNPKNQSLDEGSNAREENDSEYVNPRGVRFVAQDEEINLQPYGLRCVRELFSFLISLCNPIDNVNTSSMVHLGLCLVETALEVGADHLAKYPSLLQLVKDPLCRNLLSLLSSERVSIFALDLQVSFLLFESLRTHLKFQMESFFTKLVEIIMSDCAKNSYELKEITHLSLESIGQLWRIPGFCTELYLNYDCDIYCSNLFEDVTKLLSKTIVTAGIYNYHTLALDALFTIIDSIEANCHQIKSGGARSSNESDKTTDSQDQQVENLNSGNREVSIDMFDSSETGDESVVHDISQYITCAKMGRHRPTINLPTPKQLDDVKNRKRWIATGTEYFNQKPEKGIEFLQEHGILTVPLDPLEIALFLRNNPGLDKKMIGEYISKKKNVESRILATYAESFDMKGLRVDQALRLYLETFRLPGEAPLIFLVMEHFSEHWHESNNKPFANTDAAFRLAYAIIMLNMDQHNHNAKKLNIPMNAEDFVRNLRGCNGPDDFDQKMLEAVFHSIKNEEIVMPAERTGIVKENYLWKVLLRRGATREGVYSHAPSGAFDKELFTLIWGPTIAALSSIFEKSPEPVLYSRALEGFDKCASIVGQYSLTNELDTLVLSLCKFTGLLSLPEQTQYIAIGVSLGHAKSRSALKKVFSVCHRHANSLREGWKHILDVVLALFKGRLLPKSLTEADDFFSPTGKVSLLFEPSQQPKIQESGLFSSLYSYIALSSDSNTTLRLPTQEESEVIDVSSECVMQCNIPGMLLTDSKFLQLDSLQELIKCLISAGKAQESQKLLTPPYREDPTVFFLELLIKVVIQNRDRVSHVWQMTESHVVSLMHAAAASYNPLTAERPGALDRYALSTSVPLERATTGLLRLAICLMRSEECASDVLRSLKALLDLSYLVYHSIASRIAVGLFELVKTSAQNIHSADDWAIVFTLLETTGAGAMHLKQDENSLGSKSDGAVSSEDDSVSTDRGYTSDSELSQSPQTQGWILVGKNAETGNIITPMENPLVHPCALRPHDPLALLKCWECLAFIVRDVAHITPYNFESCVNCIRTFVEASLHGTNEDKVTSSTHPYSNKDGKRKKIAGHSRRAQKQQNSYDRSTDGIHDNERDDVPDGYQLISIQLLDLMHTLHSRTAQIFKWWREESNLSNFNQSDSNGSTALEWCDLWHLAWQPLLQGIARLCTDNRKQVSNSAVTYLQRALLVHDLQTLSGEEWEACFHGVLFPLLGRLTKHHDEIRLRANTIMCKVFLHHLTPLLSRPSFQDLWLELLDLMKSTMTGPHTTDLLYEATLESLKNMLLVMDSVKVFNDGDNYSNLWNLTWDRVNSFIPNLKDELFKPVENLKPHASLEDKREQSSVTETTAADILPSIAPASYRITSPLPSVVNPLELQTNVGYSGQIYQPVAITMGNSMPPSGQNQTSTQSHNPANTGNKGSSIILQPPSQLHTPLFSHLGQMVSTPIGVAVPAQSVTSPYPILCPSSIPQKYYNPQLQNVSMPPQTPQQNIQMYNQNPQQNPNVGLPPSQFTLISPRRTQTVDSNRSDDVNKSESSETQIAFDKSSRYKIPLTISQDYPQRSLENVSSVDVQQPGSLYREYLTDPYNPSPEISQLKAINVSTDNILTMAPDLLNQIDASHVYNSRFDIDKNFNFPPHRLTSDAPVQKCHSVNSSPLRNIDQAKVSFGSSDNIKNVGRPEIADNSFLKYFYTESTNIPPGSEMLYGDSCVSMNEG